MSDQIESFLHGLYDTEPKHKLAAAEFEHLTLNELETVLGLNISDEIEEEKVAEDVAKFSYYNPRWIKQFEGTPLHAEAIALAEEDLAIEAQRIQERTQSQEKWTARDALELKRHLLGLKLQKMKLQGLVEVDDDDDDDDDEGEAVGVLKSASGEPAGIGSSGNIEYGGDVNTGEAAAPKWPRAAMGVDAAGRKATPSEAKQQQDTATPQHVEPKTASLLEAVKRASMSDAQQEKGLGKAVRNLAKSDMDPDQKRALMKGQRKAIKKELKEGDPVKLSSLVMAVRGASRRGLGTRGRQMAMQTSSGAKQTAQKATKVPKKSYRGETVPGVAEMRARAQQEKARSAFFPKGRVPKPPIMTQGAA
jgi:hypothetical protein